MRKITTPFGESNKRQSISKKILELALASPLYFFTYISPLLALSKVELVTWWSNN